MHFFIFFFFFFFNDTATTEIYTLSLHDRSSDLVFEAASDHRSLRSWSDRSRRTDRKSTRLNSSHTVISYAVFCLKKKKKRQVAARQLGRDPTDGQSQTRDLPIRFAMAAGAQLFFFFNDTATTEIYTLSLHDALPI